MRYNYCGNSYNFSSYSSLSKDHQPTNCTLEGRSWWHLPLWESQVLPGWQAGWRKRCWVGSVPAVPWMVPLHLCGNLLQIFHYQWQWLCMLWWSNIFTWHCVRHFWSCCMQLWSDLAIYIMHLESSFPNTRETSSFSLQWVMCSPCIPNTAYLMLSLISFPGTSISTWILMFITWKMFMLHYYRFMLPQRDVCFLSALVYTGICEAIEKLSSPLREREFSRILRSTSGREGACGPVIGFPCSLV